MSPSLGCLIYAVGVLESACLPVGKRLKAMKHPHRAPPPGEGMGPRESPGGADSTGVAGQHPALSAVEEDSLYLHLFAVTFNPCRGWRVLCFWSWLFIWGGYCWLWPQGVDLRSKYYRFLSEALRSLCQGPSLLSRILDLARLAVLPRALSGKEEAPAWETLRCSAWTCWVHPSFGPRSPHLWGVRADGEVPPGLLSSQLLWWS